MKPGFLAALAACSVSAAAAPCPIPGEKIHWIADYCMATLGTDDEIPASECVSKELARAPKDECVAKREYKRALCERSIQAGTTASDLRACLADPRFMGRTVRNGGVGG